MNSDTRPEVTALAINVTIPEALRWTGTRRGQTFTLAALVAEGATRAGSLWAAHRGLR